MVVCVLMSERREDAIARSGYIHDLDRCYLLRATPLSTQHTVYRLLTIVRDGDGRCQDQLERFRKTVGSALQAKAEARSPDFGSVPVCGVVCQCHRQSALSVEILL